MKYTRRIASLLLALVMVFAMATTAMAADAPKITINSGATSDNTQSETTQYTYYQIMLADISGDNAAYYVTNETQANALSNTGLFTVTKADDARWNVVLTNDETTAEAIATALNNIKDTFTTNGNFTMTNGSATATVPSVGYYLITSSLGSKLAVQTLGDVTITEKNTYPSNTKTDDKETVSIGETVTYTVTVTIPENVAEKEIKVIDTISKGLTMNPAISVTGGDGINSLTFEENNAYTATAGEKQYIATISANTVLANKGKTLTLTYTATLNENAIVNVAETNKAHIEYDNYVTKDIEVEVKTHGFSVKKIDGANVTANMTSEEKLAIDALSGAEFSLWTAATGGTQINLVKNTDGTYRVATAAEADAEGFTSAVIEIGTGTINGLAAGTYYLQEDVAPSGYNKLTSREAVAVSETTSAEGVDIAVQNNAGSVLPSTGGMGTTLFYAVGGILVLAAVVLLVTKKRMAAAE